MSGTIRWMENKAERHDRTTRRAARVLAICAVLAAGVTLAAYLSGAIRAQDEVPGAGVVPVAYFGTVLLLSVLALRTGSPNARRRLFWAVALLFAPPALYLFPVFVLSGPMLVGCVAAGTAAYIVGHRQRCTALNSLRTATD